jgi:phosphatidylserine/phosphatidylglycerophosphate/cardiolipin synthase-like enzyme
MGPDPVAPKRTADLVITAPDPIGNRVRERLGCRSTLGVLTQLLARSRQEIILAAPFLHAEQGVIGAANLFDAVAAALQRGVRVDLFSSGDALGAVIASGLLATVPSRLRLYQPRANATDPRAIGSHAKVCICDGSLAYVGSANVTGPGLTANFEIGLLVEGEVAAQIRQVWAYMVEEGFFLQVYASPADSSH